MSSLLHISASPRGESSESLAIARTFLNALADRRPEISVETFDLWDGSLPPFGPEAAAAKMAVFAGGEPAGEEAAAWQAAERTFGRFAAADYYLFSVPMWNHGVPYVLKQFIDVISQPGMVFSFDPEDGYTGLVTGKRAVVIYTGAVYGPGRPESFGTDFQRPYFAGWLAWAGITDFAEVSFRPNLATGDADAGRQAAHAAARDLAKTF
ncbi:MAG: NAD(P)H-dependent oxidoreductase [Nocardiopsaceae bacterium]|jgi:FMN-dependent NADH-azoreductase|nr:NAD(P)H-dependent oxidoreductase [Nocardiopsaceae bacterium]